MRFQSLTQALLPQVSRRPSKNAPAAVPVTQLSQALQRPDRLDGHPTSSGSQQTTVAPSLPAQQHPVPAVAPVPMNQPTSAPTSHGPARTVSEHQFEQPYFADEDLWDCPDLPHTVRLRQLQRMIPESEVNSDVSEEETMLTQAPPALPHRKGSFL